MGVDKKVFFFISVAILSNVVSDVNMALEEVKEAIKRKCEIHGEPEAFDELAVNISKSTFKIRKNPISV